MQELFKIINLGEFMSDTMLFGKYISYLRQSRNYALREFADMIGISPFYLCSIENGRKNNPSVEILGRVYNVLQLSKAEMEKLLDLHAEVNGCVSYDVVDYIVRNRNICSKIRSERDTSDTGSAWNDFINRITR